MFRTTTSKQANLRFRRWSRAKYAAFCSLGCVVTIGCLSVSIADKSVSKSVKANTLAFVSSTVKNTDSELNDSEKEIAFQLTELINPTTVATNDSAAKSIHLNIHPNG